LSFLSSKLDLLLLNWLELVVLNVLEEDWRRMCYFLTPIAHLYRACSVIVPHPETTFLSLRHIDLPLPPQLGFSPSCKHHRTAALSRHRLTNTAPGLRWRRGIHRGESSVDALLYMCILYVNPLIMHFFMPIWYVNPLISSGQAEIRIPLHVWTS
jgi:hypothetical protein